MKLRNEVPNENTGVTILLILLPVTLIIIIIRSSSLTGEVAAAG